MTADQIRACLIGMLTSEGRALVGPLAEAAERSALPRDVFSRRICENPLFEEVLQRDITAAAEGSYASWIMAVGRAMSRARHVCRPELRPTLESFIADLATDIAAALTAPRLQLDAPADPKVAPPVQVPRDEAVVPEPAPTPPPAVVAVSPEAVQPPAPIFTPRVETPSQAEAFDTSVRPDKIVSCLFPMPRAKPQDLVGWLHGAPGHPLLLGVSAMEWDIGEIGEEIELIVTDLFASDGSIGGDRPLPAAALPVEDPSARADWVLNRLCEGREAVPYPEINARIFEVIDMFDPARAAFMRAHGIIPRMDRELSELLAAAHAGFDLMVRRARFQLDADSGEGAISHWDPRGAPADLSCLSVDGAMRQMLYRHIVMSMSFGEAAFETACDIRLCEIHAKTPSIEDLGRVSNVKRFDRVMTDKPHVLIADLMNPDVVIEADAPPAEAAFAAPSGEPSEPQRDDWHFDPDF